MSKKKKTDCSPRRRGGGPDQPRIAKRNPRRPQAKKSKRPGADAGGSTATPRRERELPSLEPLAADAPGVAEWCRTAGVTTPWNRRTPLIFQANRAPWQRCLPRERKRVRSLKLSPHNARAHPERSLQPLTESLYRFGQQKPIVIDRHGVIVAGEGTYRAACRLAWPSVWVHRTHLEGIEARAYAVMDNRTSDHSQWLPEIGAELAEISAADPDLVAMLPDLRAATPEMAAPAPDGVAVPSERRRESAPTGEADVRIRIGAIRCLVPGDLYAEWLRQLYADVGDSPEALRGEILRRLGVEVSSDV